MSASMGKYKQEREMKMFKIFGYSITIRKIKERKPHPMNCKAYHEKLAKANKLRTEQMREEVNARKNPTK